MLSSGVSHSKRQPTLENESDSESVVRRLAVAMDRPIEIR